MKKNRFADGQSRRGRVRADLFELANVGFLFVFGREQRPDLRDLVALDVEQARAFGRVKPLVQRSCEVVAIEIGLLEIELGKRMRAVDDRLDTVTSRHLADSFDRSNLSGEIDLMRDLNQPSARRDGALKSVGDFVDVLWRNRNLDEVESDTLALFALANRRQHSAVVLRRRQAFTAALKIHSEQQRLEPFRSAARNGYLFTVAAEQLGEPGTNRFRLRLAKLPHLVRRALFLLPDVTYQRFGHDARAGTDTAVVQVDDAARHGESILDRRPVVFIHRRLFRRQMRG